MEPLVEPPGGKAEDVQSIMSTWEIKPNTQNRRRARQDLLQTPTEAPAAAAVAAPAPSAKPLQQQLP